MTNDNAVGNGLCKKKTPLVRAWTFGVCIGLLVMLGLGSREAMGDDHTGCGERASIYAPSDAPKDRPYGFEYFVGLVGSPAKPDTTWSDEVMKQIKDLGVNMLQLSIAWGSRPAGEVLNLEDLTPAQITNWKHRVSQAKKFGFSTIAQFGVPRVEYVTSGWSVVQPACIMDSRVREKYSRLLGDFLNTFPDVDNVFLYTFDQDAWICSEFGPCPRCSGIPIHERLSGFLNLMNSTMQKHHPGSTLWWKPWELSNGQVVQILRRVEPKHFGLILNSSYGNEAYVFNDRSFASDLGVKRTVQLARDLEIPVIGEIDYTFYKGYYPINDFCPRFVYENLQGWKQMAGVVGFKEYFGLAPSDFSVNAAMLKACIEAPEASLDDLLKTIAAPYGKKAAPHMLVAWEKVAQGIEALPWDVSYAVWNITHNAGPGGAMTTGDAYHNWEPVTIPTIAANTPAWRTYHRSNFMLTDEFKADPWVFETMGLQLDDGAILLFEAVSAFDKAIGAGGPRVDDIRQQRESIFSLARTIRARSFHFLETLAAHDARLVGGDEKQQAIVFKRLEELLVKDLENQSNAPAMAQKLEEFRTDPKKWIGGNLNPNVLQVNTAIDWYKFVPSPR